MIIVSIFLPKALSILSLLTTSAAVVNDVVEQHRPHDDATTLSKQTYIVTFIDNGVSPAEQCEALAISMGGFVDYVYDQVFNGCSLTFPVDQSQAEATFMALSINTAVMDVEEDHFVHTFDPPASFDPDVASSSPKSPKDTTAVTVSSWGIDRIDQCALPLDGHTTKQDSTGVKVFILDTGIRGDHVEFASGMISTEDCHYSAVLGENPLTDGHGHGLVLMVISIVAVAEARDLKTSFILY